jgi:hypothetical protein
MPESNKQTLAQEFQKVLFDLFQSKLFSMSGVRMKGTEGFDEEFISKAELIDKGVEILNEFGEILALDERLKQ